MHRYCVDRRSDLRANVEWDCCSSDCALPQPNVSAFLHIVRNVIIIFILKLPHIYLTQYPNQIAVFLSSFDYVDGLADNQTE